MKEKTYMMDEEVRAILTEAQTIAKPEDKAQFEFALCNYQDLVSEVFINCQKMGISPAMAVVGYIENVAMCIASFTARPKPGHEETAAKLTGIIFTNALIRLYKESL